jgi:hypothetical protein
MKPLGKTPYEIRLELLQLAREMLNSKYIHSKDEGAIPPSADEVIQEAERLNSFVSKTQN